MSDDPDVYLVGEQHNVADHADMEVQVIDQADPDYVLSEHVDEEDEGLLSYNLQALQDYKTVFDAQKTYSTQHGGSILEHDPDYIAQQAQEKADEYDGDAVYGMGGGDNTPKPDGVVPEDGDELLSTPAYELHPAVLSTLVDDITQREQAESDAGNTQEAATLGNIRSTYERFLDAEEAPNSTAGRERLVDYISRNNITFKPLAKHGQKEQHARAIDEGDDEREQAINEEREEYMAERIEEYASESDGPVVAVMGKAHVEEDSHLRAKLEEDDVDYQTVTPEDRGFSAERVVEQTETGDTEERGEQTEEIDHDMDIEVLEDYTPERSTGIRNATSIVADRYRDRASTAWEYTKKAGSKLKSLLSSDED